MKKIIARIAVAIIVCIIVFVAYSNMRHGNRLEVVYGFKNDSRIFGLYPADRVSLPYRDGTVQAPSGEGKMYLFQEMAASPIYLDIRYWQTFSKAQVEIWYSKDSELDFQIGYKVGKDFQWKLFKPSSATVSRKDSTGERVEYSRSEVVFENEYVSRGVHRWILSSANAQELEKTIRIYGIKFTFSK